MEQIILKKPIEAYFRGANTHDRSLLNECFAEDAVVQDEGQVYRGIGAILEWVEETHKEYNHVMEVREILREVRQIWIFILLWLMKR